jgi:hypothetical protein
MWDWLFGRKKSKEATPEPPAPERSAEPSTSGAPPVRKRVVVKAKSTVSVDSLSFDLTDCSLQEHGDNRRGWMSSAEVAHLVRFQPGPPDWPFDLTDPEGAAAFYREQCADNGGVMLSMDMTTLDGCEALHGLFKYRAPTPRSLAMYYVGILWIPFREGRFQVNVEAMEIGRTGVREAAVALLEGDAWPKPPADAPPIKVKSAEELFARMRSSPVRPAPSDDEKYDQSFPDHPLSKVRARLSEVMATLKLDASARAMKPFRKRR